MFERSSAYVLLLVAFIGFGLSGCGFDRGARVTPGFMAALGSPVYLHPPRDQTLSGWMETYIAIELENLGFKIVDQPADEVLMAYYYYSYDWQEPSYIRDFMIVFKPYPGYEPELLASATCYNRCSNSFLQAGGREVHEAFTALREEMGKAGRGGLQDPWN